MLPAPIVGTRTTHLVWGVVGGWILPVRNSQRSRLDSQDSLSCPAGDTLGGHIDDVEPDQAAPIVTVSLGCHAIFLMGGHTRDTAPTALRLRSGDVLVLGGAARRCYHGEQKRVGVWVTWLCVIVHMSSHAGITKRNLCAVGVLMSGASGLLLCVAVGL